MKVLEQCLTNNKYSVVLLSFLMPSKYHLSQLLNYVEMQKATIRYEVFSPRVDILVF